MAFQEFDVEEGFYFAGFKNFTQIFKDFKTEQYLVSSIENSLELFLWTFVFSAMLSVFFSYYIYKENPMSGFFKIILYLPHIISGVVFVVMFKYFANMAVPRIWEMVFGEKIKGLIVNPDTAKTTILVFSIWVSFGTNVLMYTSAMSSISPSIIESAQLEGIKPMQELWYIVVPCIWHTFVTFMLVSIVGIFTNQMSLYTFFNVHAPQKLYTFGYYLYAAVINAERIDYPYLSAMGMLLTAVAIPITLIARYLFNKLGPKVV
jgi:ABC-type sugar transport system permease subunit